MMSSAVDLRFTTYHIFFKITSFHIHKTIEVESKWKILSIMVDYFKQDQIFINVLNVSHCIMNNSDSVLHCFISSTFNTIFSYQYCSSLSSSSCVFVLFLMLPYLKWWWWQRWRCIISWLFRRREERVE